MKAKKNQQGVITLLQIMGIVIVIGAVLTIVHYIHFHH